MPHPVLRKKVGETTITRVVTSREELEEYQAKGYTRVTAPKAETESTKTTTKTQS